MKENQDTKISKQEKLEYVLKIIRDKKISNYEIEKNTGISQAGLGSITNGQTKNPRLTTINTLYEYLQQKYNVDIVKSLEPKDDKMFSSLSIEEKLNIIHQQNVDLMEENENLKDLIDTFYLTMEISLAPILRHFDLSKDTTPAKEENKSSIN
ncbi:helix-turn-helix domain-containing protein [Chryseobacterium balustinum]|uniref:helix-turn-helix domain-containing protein n=1 Tax=Chryseobacterium balustinum TaxID=246 RepID=UPI003CECB83D